MENLTNQRRRISNFLYKPRRAIFFMSVVCFAMCISMVSANVEVILNSPANNYVSPTSKIIFNCSANITGGIYLTNISLWTNETGIWTYRKNLTIGDNYNQFGMTTNTVPTPLVAFASSDGADAWKLFDDDDATNLNWGGHNGDYTTLDTGTLNTPTSIRLINQDSQYGIKAFTFYGSTDGSTWITLTSNSAAQSSSPQIFNFSNAIAYRHFKIIVNSNQGNVGGTNLYGLSWNDKKTSLTQTWTYDMTISNMNWSCQACDSDGNCGFATENRTVSNKILINSQTYNSTSYETASETFNINITSNNSLTAVTLDYNGTDYTATKSGNIWSKTIDIPTGIQNNSFKWKFTYAGDTINSGTYYQNVEETVFTLCNATYTNDFLNITFKDESDASAINASIPTSTFEYYLGSGTVTKTYNLINNTDNNNYLFCATPSRTMHVNPYVQYKRNADYPQRIWDAAIQDYTNTLSTQVLYLLESADGIYVTFQVINVANQLISGVDITATREIESIDTVVAFGTTGDSGTVTFWLNPDFLHTFDLTKSGYTDYSTSLTPTQTSYTITIGGAAETENSTIQGITKSILPTNSYLVNDTDYTFGFTLDSSYWDVSDYGFDLRLSNGTIITGDNTGVEGTALTKVYGTNNQSIIYLDYYWVINDVYTNSTVYWIIQNTENTQWSIAVFFTDLNTYIDSGIYGLDNFGKNLIIFLILFLSVGIMSYKYGATSPLAISSLIFGIIFFFDIVVGLIPSIRGIDYMLTYLSALILTLSIFNEVKT